MLRKTVSILLGLVVTAGAYGASVDGVEIHWESDGDGPTIVFVHGWTCDTTVWSDQMSAFSGDYQVIAIDLPGHGQSDAPENDEFTAALYADAIEAVLAEAGADRVVMVGHSMGVPVILHYSRSYPDRVVALVSVDGPAGGPPPGDAQEPRPALTFTKEQRETSIRSFFVPETSEQIRQQVLEMMLAPSNERAAAILTPFFDPSFSFSAPDAVPNLMVFAGNREPLGQEAIEAVSPASTFVQVPATGHFLMMEKPIEFNGLMRGFLAEVGF